MPFVVSLVPTSTERKITKVKGIPSITEENPIVVSFRQATGEETDKRQVFNFTPFTRTYSDESNYGIDKYEAAGKPVGERWAYDIWLTLTDCDIEAQDEKGATGPMFKFSEINGVRKVAGAFEPFYKRFNTLPDALREAIHDACLECNPTWAGGQEETEEGNE
jgi:hypothetical protein